MLFGFSCRHEGGWLTYTVIAHVLKPTSLCGSNQGTLRANASDTASEAVSDANPVTFSDAVSDAVTCRAALTQVETALPASAWECPFLISQFVRWFESVSDRKVIVCWCFPIELKRHSVTNTRLTAFGSFPPSQQYVTPVCNQVYQALTIVGVTRSDRTGSSRSSDCGMDSGINCGDFHCGSRGVRAITHR